MFSSIAGGCLTGAALGWPATAHTSHFTSEKFFIEIGDVPKALSSTVLVFARTLKYGVPSM
ncbi:hypothetical protein D9M68_859340 [compost metagenome]